MQLQTPTRYWMVAYPKDRFTVFFRTINRYLVERVTLDYQRSDFKRETEPVQDAELMYEEAYGSAPFRKIDEPQYFNAVLMQKRLTSNNKATA